MRARVLRESKFASTDLARAQAEPFLFDIGLWTRYPEPPDSSSHEEQRNYSTLPYPHLPEVFKEIKLALNEVLVPDTNRGYRLGGR